QRDYSIRIFRRHPHSCGCAKRKPGNMCFGDSHCAHERHHIIREKFCAVCALRCLRLASPAKIQRDAGEMLGVLCHLECIAGVIGGKVGNQDQRLSASLLVIIHGDVIGFDPGHGEFLLFEALKIILFCPSQEPTWETFRSSGDDTSRTLDDYLAGCTEGTISSNLRHCSSPSELDLPCRCASKKPSRHLLTTCSPRSGAMILPPNRVIVSGMTKGASVKLKCPVPLTERISTGIFPLLSAKSIHVFRASSPALSICSPVLPRFLRSSSL